MNRDEITRMWEKANGWNIESCPKTIDDIARFADLIVAAERQRKAWDAKYWTEYEHDVAEATREHSAKMLSEEGWLMAATLVRVKK